MIIIVDRLSFLRVMPTLYEDHRLSHFFLSSYFQFMLPFLFSLSFNSLLMFLSFHDLNFDWHLKVLPGLWSSLSIIVVFS